MNSSTSPTSSSTHLFQKLRHCEPSATANMDKLEGAYFKISTALEHQRQLKRQNQTLREAVDKGTLELEDLQIALEQCANAINGVCGLLDSCLESIPVTMKTSEKSALVAEKVFGIPELLEQILLPLNARELLTTCAVNKTMAATILSSPTQSRKLALTPDHKSFFYTPFKCGDFNSVTMWCGDIEYEAGPSEKLLNYRSRSLSLPTTSSRHLVHGAGKCSSVNSHSQR